MDLIEKMVDPPLELKGQMNDEEFLTLTAVTCNNIWQYRNEFFFKNVQLSPASNPSQNSISFL